MAINNSDRSANGKDGKGITRKDKEDAHKAQSRGPLGVCQAKCNTSAMQEVQLHKIMMMMIMMMMMTMMMMMMTMMTIMIIMINVAWQPATCSTARHNRPEPAAPPPSN